jgi:hypothetical protein
MRKLIRERQKKVLDYLETVDCSPLYFIREYDKKNKIAPVGKTVPELVLSVLKLSDTCYSTPTIFVYWETSPNRHRSSLDIWRHIKSVRPETTIFEVMEALYELRDQLTGNFCGTVMRTVFDIRVGPYRGRILQARTFHTREYELNFINWKNITK